MEQNENTQDTVQISIDSVCILRAIMKISSSLNELDELAYGGKYIKYNLKKEVKKWYNAIEATTAPLMRSLVSENDNLLVDVYTSIEDVNKNLQMSDLNKKNLILFYVKLSSAVSDLSEIKEHSHISFLIKHYTENLIEAIEKQYRPIIDVVDKDGKSVLDFISFYNEVGKKIMHTGEVEQEKE